MQALVQARVQAWVIGLAAVAGVFGAAGVGLAAAGAHIAGGGVVTTAAYFLLFHAAALIALSTAAALLSARVGICLAASCITAGSILFSGDLALRGLAGLTLLRLAAPTGGILLIVGWLGAAVALPLAIRATFVQR